MKKSCKIIGLSLGILAVVIIAFVIIKKPKTLFHFFCKKPIAYLTINGGPSADTKNKVDYLVANNIPALFFCTGQQMEKYPDAVIYAIQNGFTIGNNSYSNPHFSELSKAHAQEEILKTEKIINNLYLLAGAKRLSKVFRFPYGDKGNHADLFNPTACTTHEIIFTKNLQLFLKRSAFRQPAFEKITHSFYVDQKFDHDNDVVWTMDENSPNLAPDAPTTTSAEILLMHDEDTNNQAFKASIEKLKTKGFVFTMPELKSAYDPTSRHNKEYHKA